MRSEPEDDPELAEDWLGLGWSAWMPLHGAHPLALQQLPEAPGIYRLRPERQRQLICLAIAPEGVRLSVDRLARQVRLATPPASDNPIALWLWQRQTVSSRGLQVSGAVVSGVAQDIVTMASEMPSTRLVELGNVRYGIVRFEEQAVGE